MEEPRSTFTRASADARRLSLVEATARVLARDGAGGASVRAVAVEAGVSPGLVTHHFGSIDALIADTYAHVGAQVEAALNDAVALAGEIPRARLDAYVTASFAAPIADPALLATWTAFWSLTRSNAAVAASHADGYAAYRRALEALLAACGVADTRTGAIGIAALVDGLWLELCLAPGTFTADEARAIATRYLDAITSPDR